MPEAGWLTTVSVVGSMVPPPVTWVAALKLSVWMATAVPVPVPVVEPATVKLPEAPAVIV